MEFRSGHRPYWFSGLRYLRFALLPLIVLAAMSGLFDLYVEDMAFDQPGSRLSARFEENRTDGLLAGGRFEWMGFVLASAVIFPAIAWTSLITLRRHLAPGPYVVTGALWGAFSLLWIWNSLIRKDRPFGTDLLFILTEDLALARYEHLFADLALQSTELIYGSGLAVTLLLILAASAVLSHPHPRRAETPEELGDKRRDLKLMIGLGSILLTFIAGFLGAWLGWPVNFVAAANDGQPASGHAQELKAVAEGIRLYFGAGYTLALIAFSIPAVLALSRRLAPVEPGQEEPAPAFLMQRVFMKDELGVLLSMTAPFLTGLIGAALKL